MIKDTRDWIPLIEYTKATGALVAAMLILYIMVYYGANGLDSDSVNYLQQEVPDLYTTILLDRQFQVNPDPIWGELRLESLISKALELRDNEVKNILDILRVSDQSTFWGELSEFLAFLQQKDVVEILGEVGSEVLLLSTFDQSTEVPAVVNYLRFVIERTDQIATQKRLEVILNMLMVTLAIAYLTCYFRYSSNHSVETIELEG